MWQLGTMGLKDCTLGQVPNMKGMQSSKGNHSGMRLRISDHIEDSPTHNRMPETNKNLTQSILPYIFASVYACTLILLTTKYQAQR